MRHIKKFNEGLEDHILKTQQQLNEASEKLNISDVISSINNYDIELLKKSLNFSIVNKQIFKIFDDDKKPLWTPLNTIYIV